MLQGGIHPCRILPPSHQRAMLSIAYTYNLCGTGPACSVFVSRLILEEDMYYVFISDPGNFQVCVSVDAIPVLPPCGDKLKRGAAGFEGPGGRDTLRGPLSYRGGFNKPGCGQA